MKPVEPILVIDLFEPMQDHLLSLLSQLSDDEWYALTPCPGWTVKDIALHLLADDVSRLTRGRDDDFSYDLPPGKNFVDQINEHNRRWLVATHRMSTRLACEFLDFTGRQVIEYFKSLPLMELGDPVSWAGPERAPIWLDVAREYSERWHHQQHIREAVQRPGLTEASFMHPLLDTLVRALPWTFHFVVAPEGTVVELCIEGGDLSQSWFLIRKGSHWSLWRDVPDTPAATVILDQETAWKLFTKGITKEDALARATVDGDETLALKVFDTVSIIA